MTAAIFNLTDLEAGATNLRTLPITYPNGDPFDLSPFTTGLGGTLRGQFRLTNADSTTVVFQVVTGTSSVDPSTRVYIESPPTNGRLVVVLSDSDTSDAQTAAQFSGTYDIEGVDADDIVTRLVQGTWSLSKENTRVLI